MKSALFAIALSLASAASAFAQPSPGPQSAAAPPSIPAPRDVAYPGVMRLEVDATDIARRIFRVKQTVPVAAPGRTTLLYPQWIPGNHAPRGQIEKVAGLVVRANGRVLPWTRDPLDVYAFHVDVPQSAGELQVEFQYLSPTATPQGRVVMTPEMLNLQWFSVSLYPAGYYARRIMVEASVKLPSGWGYGAALDVASKDGAVTRFKPVTYETLIDSPMFAGRNFRQFDLDPNGRSPVRLNVVADSPDELNVDANTLEKHRNLVRQADSLYGVRHFDRYEFLLAVSDRMGGIGVEHHRSSENGVGTGYFTAFDKAVDDRDLLAHEYTHSWNGKFRRPADLWTPSYSVPMRGSLLWVYEGQTQYWGYVLGARSGMLSKDEGLDALAATAAVYENQVGRRWRQLEDTTLDPVIARRQPQAWRTWQRSEDYYSEGQLIWLDADTLIRERSGGRRSLDDFARTFFGGKEGDLTPHTYTFEDVAAALNVVEPYDWTAFLTARVRDVASKPPLDGLTRGGWKLVYTETPTPYFTAVESAAKITNLMYALGVTLNREGDVTAVLWDSPAFNAGLTVSTRVLAVNGIAYSAERLKSAITESKSGNPLELLVKNGDHFQTVPLTYRGGLRYPRLERIQGAPDLLSRIYEPRK